MTLPDHAPFGERKPALSEVEAFLKARFDKNAKKSPLQSNTLAPPSRRAAKVEALLLNDDERAKLPETKDKYLVRENPQLIAWEREVRKFLRKLNPAHGHRVSAVMVYEWATGINVKELYDRGGQADQALKYLNKILAFYFGKPYTTYIMGRKVMKAYRVPPGWYVRRHRPMTLTLYYEFSTKTLNP